MFLQTETVVSGFWRKMQFDCWCGNCVFCTICSWFSCSYLLAEWMAYILQPRCVSLTMLCQTHWPNLHSLTKPSNNLQHTSPDKWPSVVSNSTVVTWAWTQLGSFTNFVVEDACAGQFVSWNYVILSNLFAKCLIRRLENAMFPSKGTSTPCSQSPCWTAACCHKPFVYFFEFTGRRNVLFFLIVMMQKLSKCSN